MWRDRLIRFLIIVLVAGLVLGLARTLVKRQQDPEAKSFQVPIKKKVEDWGEKVLGTVVEKLPKAPNLEEVEPEGESAPENQETQETEPIEEPVQNIQTQTQVLIETIKELPQDQIEAIKKQIYKEFCEKLLSE
ncbi:MAG TPA: hypothetical protein VMX76_02345 [Nevskiaceae bacterium]|nr:hypothetical protein [Nevskiaceae bacterium]